MSEMLYNILDMRVFHLPIQKILQVLIFLLMSSHLTAEEILRGDFAVEGDQITFCVENVSKQDVLVMGFMEGLQDATIRLESSELPVISGKKLVKFNFINKNIIWWRLRAVDEQFPGLGSEIRVSEKITNDEFREYMRANKNTKELIIEVTVRVANLKNGTIGEFSFVKLALHEKIKKP